MDKIEEHKGIITKVTTNTFVADVMIDNIPNCIRFYKEEVSPKDEPHISVGTIFIWRHGLETDKWGQRMRTSTLIFDSGECEHYFGDPSIQSTNYVGKEWKCHKCGKFVITR